MSLFFLFDYIDTDVRYVLLVDFDLFRFFYYLLRGCFFTIYYCNLSNDPSRFSDHSSPSEKACTTDGASPIAVDIEDKCCWVVCLLVTVVRLSFLTIILFEPSSSTTTSVVTSSGSTRTVSKDCGVAWTIFNSLVVLSVLVGSWYLISTTISSAIASGRS
ncbi:hypothetical protein ANTQUA_LOCUS4716 [Anthophora quadrimaculata]